jgi:WD40 repeat protein
LFVDETILTANPGLWSTIEEHLDRSRWLVYLASPAAANSPWVQRELSWWLEHRGAEHLILVLTEGDIRWDAISGSFDRTATTAVPLDIVEGHYSEEPLYIDLRGIQRDQLSKRHAGFHKAVVDIAALLMGRSRDEIDGVEVRQAHQARRLIVGSIVAFAMLATFGIERALRAVAQSHVAQSRQLAGAVRAVDDPVVSLLLAVLAVQKSPTREATEALAEQLMQSSALDRTLWGHAGQVTGLAFAPEGDFAVSSGADGRVQLWNLSSAVASTLATHGESVVGVALSPDGQLVATADRTELRLTPLRQPGVAVVANTQESARPLGFSADGRYLVTTLPNHRLGRWVVTPRLEALDELEGHRHEIRAVRFSRRGNLTSLDAGGGLITWNGDGNPILHHSVRTSVSAAAPASHDPSFVIGSCAVPHFICTRGFVAAWNYATWSKTLQSFSVFQQEVQAVAWSSDGRWIAAGGCARPYWSEQGRRRCERGGLVLRSVDGTGPPDDATAGPRLAHAGAVRHVAFAADGSRAATGGDDGAVMLWHSLGGQPLSRDVRGGQGNEPRQLRFIGDRRLIADHCIKRFPQDSPVCEQHDLAILDVTSGRWRWLSLNHQGSTAIQFDTVDNSGTLVAYICVEKKDDSCAVWRKVSVSLEEGASPQMLAEMLTRPPQPGRAVSAAPGLWSAAASGLSAGARCRDNASPPLQAAATRGDVLRCGSTEIVMASSAPSDARKIKVLWRTDDDVSALALSPNGELVAIGTADGMLKVWDTRAEAFRLPSVSAHKAEVLDLAFSADGRQLASSGADSSVRVWDLAYDDPTHLACRKAGRNLSLNEWRRYIGEEFDYEEACPGLPSPLREGWSMNEPGEAAWVRNRGGEGPRIFSW